MVLQYAMAYDKEYQKAYYAKRKERLNQRRREMYQTDPAYRETTLAQKRTRYQTDAEYRERRKAEQAAYRQRNSAAIRKKDRDRTARSLVIRAKAAYGKCSKCGYAKHLGALQWAHRSADEKTAEPSWLIRAGDERASVELFKCAVLCANCHFENTHGLWEITDQMVAECSAVIKKCMEER